MLVLQSPSRWIFTEFPSSPWKICHLRTRSPVARRRTASRVSSLLAAAAAAGWAPCAQFFGGAWSPRRAWLDWGVNQLTFGQQQGWLLVAMLIASYDRDASYIFTYTYIQDIIYIYISCCTFSLKTKWTNHWNTLHQGTPSGLGTFLLEARCTPSTLYSHSPGTG